MSIPAKPLHEPARETPVAGLATLARGPHAAIQKFLAPELNGK